MLPLSACAVPRAVLLFFFLRKGFYLLSVGGDQRIVLQFISVKVQASDSFFNNLLMLKRNRIRAGRDRGGCRKRLYIAIFIINIKRRNCWRKSCTPLALVAHLLNQDVAVLRPLFLSPSANLHCSGRCRSLAAFRGQGSSV